MSTSFDLLPQDRAAPSHTAAALRIVDRIEKEIVRQEHNFGRDRLLNVVTSFGLPAYHNHTSYYRRVIRETTWPLGTWIGGTHSEFLRGYECSALGYVWSAFQALRYLAGTTQITLEQIYSDALIAESLRGQFGKSSPDGLDSRLLNLENQFLNQYGDEETLIALCTPAGFIKTAEASLVDDFQVFRKVFPSPPTIRDILNTTAQGTDAIWRFLRRSIRWFVPAAERLYDQLVPSESQTKAEHATREHEEWRLGVLANLPPPATTIIDAIMSLNVLNLVLEPAYSFKGCVGFPLGMIFREMRHAERKAPLDHMQLILGEWNLFELANKRLIHG